MRELWDADSFSAGQVPRLLLTPPQNSISNITSKVCFIYLKSRSATHSCPFPLDFPLHFSPICAIYPTHLFLLRFNHPNNIWWKVQIIKFFITQFCCPPVTCSLEYLNITISFLILNSLNLWVTDFHTQHLKLYFYIFQSLYFQTGDVPTKNSELNYSNHFRNLICS
jgi:hypothetical protein